MQGGKSQRSLRSEKPQVPHAGRQFHELRAVALPGLRVLREQMDLRRCYELLRSSLLQLQPGRNFKASALLQEDVGNPQAIHM